jgi:hypothetical protein
VNPAGLGPGVYVGNLTIASIPLASSRAPSAASETSLALQESVTIPVELVVLPDVEPRSLYLPLIDR